MGSALCLRAALPAAGQGVHAPSRTVPVVPAAGHAGRAHSAHSVLDTDQFRARQTLEALRVGIVPVQDAETLTIGLEAERVTLDRALDRSHERGGDVLAVIGDYGFGKSHFIELAARRGAARELPRGRRQPRPGRSAAGQGAQDLRGAGRLRCAIRTRPDAGCCRLIEKALARPAVVAEFVRLCPREVQECPLAAALTRAARMPQPDRRWKRRCSG